MNKNEPLVSIVVPVYNAERFIADTIKTVLDQTYQNWELILIDDKSTDKSIVLINTFLRVDKRIKLLRNNTNLHAALTRNKGIKAASGQYIAFLDADDLWATKKLEQQIAFMKRQDCAFSFTGYEFADAAGIPNGKKVSVPISITYKEALKKYNHIYYYRDVRHGQAYKERYIYAKLSERARHCYLVEGVKGN